MKNVIISLVVAASFFSSCYKEKIESKPEKISFTQWRLFYTKKNLDSTKLVINFPVVTDQALIAQYKSLPVKMGICPEMKDTLFTEIKTLSQR